MMRLLVVAIVFEAILSFTPSRRCRRRVTISVRQAEEEDLLELFKFKADDGLQKALGVGPRPPVAPPPDEAFGSSVPFFLGGGGSGSGKNAWDTMTVSELKSELKSRGLPVSGKKSDLVERLEISEAEKPVDTVTERVQEDLGSRAHAITHMGASAALEGVQLNVIEDIVGPLFAGGVEKGVDADSIKGAAIIAATFGALTTNSLIYSGVAGIAAAYVAITQGQVGKFFRTVGKAAWDTVTSAFDVFKKADTDGKLTKNVVSVAATSFAKVLEMARESQQRFEEQERELKRKEAALKAKAAAKPKPVKEKRLISEEDWEDSVRLAQEGLDGKIAGWSSTEEKSDASTVIASDNEEIEQDWDALGRVARQAVEAYEDKAAVEEVKKSTRRQQWKKEMVPTGDIAAAARAAVEIFENGGAKGTKDWSKQTVAKLRDELKSRGLPAGRKKADLVAALEKDDADSLLLADEEVEDADLEDLALAARAAVDAFESSADLVTFDDEEPSDEALWAIENGSGPLKDYASLTVSDLKDELRSRGLPLSGKKSDLIARLESADASD